MQALGDLPGGTFDSTAYAVSADGARVVGRGHGTNGYQTFVWDESEGIRNLQDVLATEYGLSAELAGWKLTEARGLSDDGQTIVGFGMNPDGLTEAWIAVLPSPRPEMSVEINGNELILSWNPPSLGWRLEWQTNSAGISSNWTTLINPINTDSVSVPFDASQRSVFFRLVQP
jgi:uncharacterized membrane protein